MGAKSTPELADELTELARKLGPEGEGLDLSDLTLELDDLVALRSLLSSRRAAIDVVNRALADYWLDVFGNEQFVTEHTIWSLTKRKGKKLVDADAFFAWLADQDADKLAALISASSIKVTGMTDTERSTFLDESPTSDVLSIGNRPRT